MLKLLLMRNHMKLGINWQERETKLCAGVIAGAILSVIFPERAETIQQSTMWLLGAVGVFTHTS